MYIHKIGDSEFKINCRQHKRKSNILTYGFFLWTERGWDYEHIVPIFCQWAQDNIGPYDPDVWQIRVNMGTYDTKISVYFKDEANAMAFKLAWGALKMERGEKVPR